MVFASPRQQQIQARVCARKGSGIVLVSGHVKIYAAVKNRGEDEGEELPWREMGEPY